MTMYGEHLIEARFLPSPSKTELYIGTLQELRTNIATTWSQVPHRIQQDDDKKNTILRVWNKKLDKVVAIFTCTPHESYLPLPGHF